jgi:molecular chaperone GrpE
MVIYGGTVSQHKENTNTTAQAEATVATEQAGRQEAAVEQGGEGVSLIEQDAVTVLQGELEQALAKAEENLNLYLAARAEMENVRKRGEREVQNARKFALKDFIDALLPVKDSLEMGIAVANDSIDVNKLREGSELTLKVFTTALEKFGVQELNPVGAKFNPELHEAMAMQPSEQAEPNTVLQVVQKGYMLNERLIRPAMVIVAQAVKKTEAGIENPQYDPK